MNEMLIDAKNTIKSPEKLAIKQAEIKANQLLGLEILSNVYMLAVLNMIMIGQLLVYIFWKGYLLLLKILMK